MRRIEAEALGIHLPVLPTLVLGGLPGPPTWAADLRAIGLDVLASGAVEDTTETVRAAVDAAAGRPVKAVAGDAVALVSAGAKIVESAVGPLSEGYALGSDEAVVAVVDGASSQIEDPNVVARRVVDAVADTPPAELWVVCSPGLDRLDRDTAVAKLRVLCESAYQARLAIAKVQFDLE